MNKIHHILITYNPYTGKGESITIYRQRNTKTYAYKWWYSDKLIINSYDRLPYSWHEKTHMILY